MKLNKTLPRLNKRLRTIKKNIDYIEANNLMYSKRYFRLRILYNDLCDEIDKLQHSQCGITKDPIGLTKYEFVLKVERNVWVMI